MADDTQFNSLLVSLLATDNDARTQAEVGTIVNYLKCVVNRMKNR